MQKCGNKCACNKNSLSSNKPNERMKWKSNNPNIDDNQMLSCKAWATFFKRWQMPVINEILWIVIFYQFLDF